MARGNVVFSDADGRIAADQVDFNAATGTGTFKDASGSMRIGSGVNLTDFAGQDPDVYFYGETIEKLGPRRYRLTGGAFTTCVQPTPRWEVTSKHRHHQPRRLRLRAQHAAEGQGRAGAVPAGDLLPDPGRRPRHRLPAAQLRHLHAAGPGDNATDSSGPSIAARTRHWSTTGTPRQAGAWAASTATSPATSRRATCGSTGSRATRPPSPRTGSPRCCRRATASRCTGTANQSLSTRLRARGYVDYFSDIVTQHLYNQNIYQATQSRRTIEGSLSGYVRRDLDERPLPAQRVPDRRHVVHRLRQHAARLRSTSRRRCSSARRSMRRWTPSSRASPTGRSGTAW